MARQGTQAVRAMPGKEHVAAEKPDILAELERIAAKLRAAKFGANQAVANVDEAELLLGRLIRANGGDDSLPF